MSARQGMCPGEWETMEKFLSNKGSPGEWETIKKFLSPFVTRESEAEDAPLPPLEWVCPQDKGCVRESGKLWKSSSPTRGVRESWKLSKSSSPPFVTRELEAEDAPLPTLEWVCPQDKGCVRTHVGDMQNRIAVLFAMSSAVVFVSTVISMGGVV